MVGSSDYRTYPPIMNSGCLALSLIFGLENGPYYRLHLIVAGSSGLRGGGGDKRTPSQIYRQTEKNDRQKSGLLIGYTPNHPCLPLSSVPRRHWIAPRTVWARDMDRVASQASALSIHRGVRFHVDVLPHSRQTKGPTRDHTRILCATLNSQMSSPRAPRCECRQSKPTCARGGTGA